MALKYDNYTGALVFILIASVMDFLDGFAARLLGAYSKLGAELDSLADIVSFGLAPACIVFSFLTSIEGHASLLVGLPFFAFLLPIFAALRLAKFNIDTRQTSSFLGLPVPANALFWASFIPAIAHSNLTNFHSQVIMITLISFFCFLMVSELPMFSLKFKTYKWKENRWPYGLILSAILLLILFKLNGICLIVCMYIFLSAIRNGLRLKRKK
jgi:CDP-diacylglycerol--serine O-phosphatidyltransferase